MATIIDTAVRSRPSGRKSGRAAGIGDADGDVVAPRKARVRPSRPGRVASCAEPESAGRGVVAWGRSHRSGEWLWLGSVAIFTFLIVMLVGLFGLGDAPMLGRTGVVEVRAGDTLWGIATRVAPDSDPQEVVARIIELNGLDSAAVESGRMLRVPTARP